MNVHKSSLKIATETLKLEKNTIENLIPEIGPAFEEVVQAIHLSKGKLIITGIGKSAIIGQKIVATLNSTGTISTFLHAADAIHGDLGVIDRYDIILFISKSGNTPEIKIIHNIIEKFGNKSIAMTAHKESYLALHSDFLLFTPVKYEADNDNLAPTCSSIAQLAMGDALAMCLSALKNFSKDDFAKFHPGGSLGKKLYLKVQHLLHLHEKPMVSQETSIEKVILEITAKRLGATAVIHDNRITGIITDGDLRRMLLHEKFNSTVKAIDIMTLNPISISPDEMAISAIQIMKKNSITQLIVTEKNEYLGMIHLHDLLKEGIAE